MHRRRRALATGLFAAGLVLATAGLAWGQGLTGGCSGTINGRAPSEMTKEDPLVIEKGGSIAVQGYVPRSVARLPKNRIHSTTTLKVWVVDNLFGVNILSIRATGPAWGGKTTVPGYLNDLVPGVYKVTGTAAGSPSWSCEGSGFVELKRGRATAATGLGVGVALGATGGGVALGGRGKRVRAPKDLDAKRVNRRMRTLVGLVNEIAPDAKAVVGADAGALIVFLLVALFFGVA